MVVLAVVDVLASFSWSWPLLPLLLSWTSLASFSLILPLIIAVAVSTALAAVFVVEIIVVDAVC